MIIGLSLNYPGIIPELSLVLLGYVLYVKYQSRGDQVIAIWNFILFLGSMLPQYMALCVS